MIDWTLTLYFGAGVFAYVIVAGITAGLNYHESRKRGIGPDNAMAGALVGSMFVPVGLALLIGLLVLRALESRQEAAEDRKRQAEEADRQRKADEAKRKKEEEELLKAEGIKL